MLASPESPHVFEGETPLLELIEKYLPLPNATTAVPVPGSETPGFSPIYRNAAFPKGLKQFLKKDLDTVHALFEAVVKQVPDKVSFKIRCHDYVTDTPKDCFETKTFREVKTLKDNLGSGILYHLQNNPYKDSSKYESHQKIDNHVRDYQKYDGKNHSFVVTLYSSNRLEWVLCDAACSSYSITSTSLYDTLGANTSEYILELTESPIIICSKKHIRQLVDLKKRYPDTLSHIISIVSMDPLFESDFSLRTLCAENRIFLNDFSQILALGEIYPMANLPPSRNTLYTISFTSGTTGSNPKGVSLTHGVSVGCLTFFLSQMPRAPDQFAFLPMAHIFQRAVIMETMATGGTIIFPQLNYSPATLVDDLKLSKPTSIGLVPRVLNKFEAVIKSATIENPNGSALSKAFLNKVFNDKMNAQEQYDGADGKSFFYDKTVIKKLKAALGFDNLQYLVVGSAPIDPKTIKFLKAALQVGISQGYGTTEMFAGISLGPIFEAKPGSSGAVGVNTEVKLRELPEMNYTNKDEGGPRGELLVRGNQLFSEYYKNPEETAKCIDAEGWYHSGDIAQISSETGRLYIIDRVKNSFKMAQGEFITPETIENNYLSNNPILTQVFVHGDSLQNYLVAILGMEKESMCQFLAKKCKVNNVQGLSNEEILALINDKTNKLILLSQLNLTVPSLKGFQKFRNAFIDFEPLTLDRGVVTPTFKIKRPVAKKFFNDILANLYKEGSLDSDAKL